MGGLLSESRLGLAEAGRHAKASPSTIWRWLMSGVKVGGGRRVRLEGVRVGGRWFTSEPALARFTEELTRASRGAAAQPKARPDVERELDRVLGPAAA